MSIKRWPVLAAAALSVGIGLLPVRSARACGGCFPVGGQSRNPTQVTSHRMALSLSKDQTTLWDQIQYVGEPEEFAWVLPIKGTVDVGLSSDLLFAQLEALTAITVTSPVVYCPSPSSGVGGSSGPCGTTSSSTKAATGGGGMSVQQGEENPVDVLAQEVVGPYETVQLASDDPVALRTWLDAHGYAIPMEVEPVVDAYVNEGFGFLALRLVPGTGIDSMRPVRVTTAGASPTLPLRMVAAGTGAMTAVSLFVVSEGSYVPQNMPFARIDPLNLVWNFDTQRSNYSELRADYFEQQDGRGWLVEAAFDIGVWAVDPVLAKADDAPAESGYGGVDGEGALEEATVDVATLFAGLDPASLALTRLNAELSREGLASDLVLGPTNAVVQTSLQAPLHVGDPCKTAFAACSDSWDGEGGGYAFGEDGSKSGCDCSAAASTGPGSLALGLGGLAFGAALLRRRRR